MTSVTVLVPVMADLLVIHESSCLHVGLYVMLLILVILGPSVTLESLKYILEKQQERMFDSPI